MGGDWNFAGVSNSGNRNSIFDVDSSVVVRICLFFFLLGVIIALPLGFILNFKERRNSDLNLLESVYNQYYLEARKDYENKRTD